MIPKYLFSLFILGLSTVTPTKFNRLYTQSGHEAQDHQVHGAVSAHAPTPKSDWDRVDGLYRVHTVVSSSVNIHTCIQQHNTHHNNRNIIIHNLMAKRPPKQKDAQIVPVRNIPSAKLA